ncbi:MAG: hypothetical protein JWM16_1412 [Verrucomicrobiales bacterium]|nr:hypothetical protein [Verrucomicrobiales bacterium]
MKLLEELKQAAEHRNLQFLVIGGFAVNLHGYSRRTFDLDILVPRESVREWKTVLASLGYSIDLETGNFLQCSPSSARGWAVDLMIVNQETFQKMYPTSLKGRVEGAEVCYPTLNHLLALKLHVLKQSLLHRFSKDLDDVVILVEVNKVDVLSDEFKQLCERYGNSAVYEQIVQISKSRH